ncbi:MAG TPA: hypothetical protein VKM72_15185 [Thermoanaerobaculia bacterium]|nr:hypothetical protein [Thermoanaerobaculia bacterium]
MTTSRPDRWGRRLLAAALVLLAAGCLLQAAQGSTSTDLSGHAAGSDDAFISYRYALNLIAGHGLVFNPGERVEGYTNLLYVLLLVPAAWLAGAERLLAISIGVNLLSAAAALLGFFGFARERLGGARAGMAALALALCPSLWVAVASGLETPLVLALQVALWIAVERTVEREDGQPLLPLTVLTVLAGLARADGFIAPLLAALYLAVRGRRRAALAVAAASLATLAALVAWRLTYYGWPLPNTYYAKVAGPLPRRIETALPQLSRVVFTTGLLVPVIALLFAILRLVQQVSRGQARLSAALSFPVFFAPAWIGYWIYVGGDVFYERFLLILFPLGIYALLQLLRTAPRAASAATLGLAILLQLAQLREDPRFRYTPEHYDRWVLLGRHLARSHPGATLATDAAGKIPYFSGLRTIDMLGLTDAHIGHVEPPEDSLLIIGHSKYDVEYVLARRPDLIATWIQSDLDMKWGLQRSRWQRAGYRLRFLVNAEPHPQTPNLLDVSGKTTEEIGPLISSGYGYGVLELTGRGEARPAPVRPTPGHRAPGPGAAAAGVGAAELAARSPERLRNGRAAPRPARWSRPRTAPRSRTPRP